MKQNLHLDPSKNLFCMSGEVEPETPFLWDSMPEYVSNVNEAYCVIDVTVEDEETFNHFMDLMDQPYTPKTKSIWYPQLEQFQSKLYKYTLEP